MGVQRGEKIRMAAVMRHRASLCGTLDRRPRAPSAQAEVSQDKQDDDDGANEPDDSVHGSIPLRSYPTFFSTLK